MPPKMHDLISHLRHLVPSTSTIAHILQTWGTRKGEEKSIVRRTESGPMGIQIIVSPVWSKKTTSTNYSHSSAYPRVGGAQTYRDQRPAIPTEHYPRQNNVNQDRSVARVPLYPMRKTTAPYPSQSGQNTWNNAIQYSHDQSAPTQPSRPKPSVVRIRGKHIHHRRSRKKLIFAFGFSRRRTRQRTWYVILSLSLVCFLSTLDVLEQSYKRSLSKYYGQKPGRNCPLSDYGDYRSQVRLVLDRIE